MRSTFRYYVVLSVVCLVLSCNFTHPKGEHDLQTQQVMDDTTSLVGGPTNHNNEVSGVVDSSIAKPFIREFYRNYFETCDQSSLRLAKRVRDSLMSVYCSTRFVDSIVGIEFLESDPLINAQDCSSSSKNHLKIRCIDFNSGEYEVSYLFEPDNSWHEVIVQVVSNGDRLFIDGSR